MADKEQATVKAYPRDSVLSLRPRSYALGKVVDVPLTRTPGGEAESDIAADLFHLYYGGGEGFAEQAPAGREVNRAVLGWLTDKPSFRRAQSATLGNITVAATTAGMMFDLATSNDAVQAAMKRQEEVADQAAAAKQYRAMEQSLRDFIEKQRAPQPQPQQAPQPQPQQAPQPQPQQAPQQPQPPDPKLAAMEAQADAYAAKAAKAEQKANAGAAQLDLQLQGMATDPMLQAALSGAQQDGAEAGQEMAHTLNQWGMGAGSPIASDPSAAMEAASMLTDKVKEIAKIAGRMRGLSLRAKRGKATAGFVPHEVEMTRNLLDAFPGETALLSNRAPAVLRAQQVGAWAARGLLGMGRNTEGKERGAFYACVDDSGSMSGQAEIVAKGLALGTAQAARAEAERPYGLVLFNSSADVDREVTSDQGWREHLRWAERHYGGGTNIGAALDFAMDRVSALKLDGYNPDILLMSDGHGYIGDATKKRWAAFAEDTGARLYYVPVGMAPQAEIEGLATEVIPLATLDEEGAAQVAETIGGYL